MAFVDSAFSAGVPLQVMTEMIWTVEMVAENLPSSAAVVSRVLRKSACIIEEPYWKHVQSKFVTLNVSPPPILDHLCLRVDFRLNYCNIVFFPGVGEVGAQEMVKPQETRYTCLRGWDESGQYVLSLSV